MKDFPKDKQLILFDGVCNLCNSTVLYVIKHDRNDRFRFAPLQSEIGIQLMKTYNMDASSLDSILLYSDHVGLKEKSTAALYITKSLGLPVNLLFGFLIIPKAIRDKVYDFIAKNRYRWYGKKTSCMIPTPELQAKFYK